MRIAYRERLNELFEKFRLMPYYISPENLSVDRSLTPTENKNIFGNDKNKIHTSSQEIPEKPKDYLESSGLTPYYISEESLAIDRQLIKT